MNKKLIIFFTLCLSLNIFANILPQIGGKLINKSENMELFLGCDGYDSKDNCHKALFILNNKVEKSQEVLNNTLVLEMGNGDEFTDRWYVFNVLKTKASTSRSPFPFFWYVINMRRSSSKFLRAFKLMDRKDKDALSESVRVSNKNFQEMIKAIQQY